MQDDRDFRPDSTAPPKLPDATGRDPLRATPWLALCLAGLAVVAVTWGLTYEEASYTPATIQEAANG
jgi:drug/metabolite transporter (DMT)-like permease